MRGKNILKLCFGKQTALVINKILQPRFQGFILGFLDVFTINLGFHIIKIMINPTVKAVIVFQNIKTVINVISVFPYSLLKLFFCFSLQFFVFWFSVSICTDINFGTKAAFFYIKLIH